MTPGLEPSGDRHGAELLHTVRWVGHSDCHSDLSPTVRLHASKYVFRGNELLRPPANAGRQWEQTPRKPLMSVADRNGGPPVRSRRAALAGQQWKVSQQISAG